MGIYLRGNAITLVERFALVNPLTLVETAANPTAVVFTVEDPNGLETTYTFGTDSNVTNPQTGVFLCALLPQLPPGVYRYRVDGTGAVTASGEGSFTVLESGVLPKHPGTVAVSGPCSPWINGSDVAAACNAGVGSNDFLLDDVAAMGADLMYELSGRLFPGICERTVRPCRQQCACFGLSSASGLGPWVWSDGSSWLNECGDTCGCGVTSVVELAGYPVREILAVKIDGQTLSSSAYRLDKHRHLVRLRDPAFPNLNQFWPGCQVIDLDDTQPGTFSVRYSWGAEPPPLGKLAAAQLACELWKATPAGGGKCALPNKVTRVVRQGVTLEKVVPVAELLRTGATGLPFVDMFIAQVNPDGRRRRSSVWSPDVQAKGRRVGQ